MGKLNEKKSLLAMALAASLAAVGCTTNQNYGNGTPTRSGPDVRSAPTSGVTSGGETYTPPMPPPMTSSYSRSEVLPSVTTKRTIRRDPNAAAAIMRQHQINRGVVYLGASNPGSGASVVDPQSNRVENASLYVNPQATVNSSISSSPTGVINSGADGSAAPTVSGGTTAAVTLPGTAVTGTGTLPSMASAAIPTVTAASASASSPIRVVRTNGNVTVTNVGTSGRSQ